MVNKIPILCNEWARICHYVLVCIAYYDKLTCQCPPALNCQCSHWPGALPSSSGLPSGSCLLSHLNGQAMMSLLRMCTSRHNRVLLNLSCTCSAQCTLQMTAFSAINPYLSDFFLIETLIPLKPCQVLQREVAGGSH